MKLNWAGILASAKKGIRIVFSIEVLMVVVSFLLIHFILFTKPYIGVANNGDFKRVLQPAGLDFLRDIRAGNAMEAYWVKDTQLMKEGKLIEAVQSVFDSPPVEKAYEKEEKEYFSTQMLPVQLSRVLHTYFACRAGEDPEIYNILLLGMVYAGFHIVALGVAVKAFKRKSKLQTAVLTGLILLMFCDAAYLAYFNSFFGEAAVMVFFLLALGAAGTVIKQRRPSLFSILFFYLAAFLFTGSKEANAPIGVFISLFGLLFLCLRKDIAGRVVIVLLSFSMLAASVYIYKTIPDGIREVNQYQTVFYGILKDSPTPEKDLEDLGIDPVFAGLKDTTYYSSIPHLMPIDAEHAVLKKNLYEKATYVNILRFYLKHPERWIQKMEITAQNSLMIRPPYLGNFYARDGYERLAFTEKFTFWSNFKKICIPDTFAFVVVFFTIYLFVLVYEFMKAQSKYNRTQRRMCIALFLLVWTTALSQFAIPILGDGEGDLAKHMFLYTSCLDILFISSLQWGLCKISRWFRWVCLSWRSWIGMFPIFLVTLLITTLLSATEDSSIRTQITSVVHQNQSVDSLSVGSYIEFGKYRGKPIVWRMIDKSRDKGILLLSERVLCYKPLDAWEDEDAVMERRKYGSNLWASSNLREWLNSSQQYVRYSHQNPDPYHVWKGFNSYSGEAGFLASFSAEERNCIKPVTHRSTLSYADVDLRAGGNRLLYWSNPVALAAQNFESAFYQYVTDTIFVPDVKELKTFVDDRGFEVKKMPTVEARRESELFTEGADKKIYGDYWLRTPYSDNASYVRYVRWDGFVYNKDACYGGIGVAPALYLQNDSIREEGTGEMGRPWKIYRIQ